jgi:alcohol dehydrogenase class IV
MNLFIFHSPTKIIFGEGTSATSSDVIKELGGSKVLVVTDAVLLKTGVAGPIIDTLTQDGSLAVTVFSDVPSDSDVDSVKKGTEVARSLGCNSVLAIGGGSVLDTAKVVNICLTFGGDILEYQGLNNLTNKLLPHIAIPTTSGTGSEVSMVAMVKDKAERKKLLFGSRFIAPDVAILDPTLLLTLPSRLTAATGMDAVTHAIEAYSSVVVASPITDLLCLQALNMLFAYLPTATKSGGDLEARAQTLVASTMAGIAFTNTGVGIVHALAHATGGQFGTHHGTTNSIFLSHGMNFNIDTIPDRYAQISRFLKFSSSTVDDIAARELIKKVEELNVELGLPRRLRDIGVPVLSQNEIEELAEVASTDPAIMFNPKEATLADIVGLYERAY